MNLHNQARQQAGSRPLQLSAAISAAAKLNTPRMVRSNQLIHTSGSDLQRRITNTNTVAENIGMAFSTRQLHDTFMNSPPHRRNLM
ncbi:MAG: CAP domain-containing protein, partial [Nitrososphaeraceae archaeon]